MITNLIQPRMGKLMLNHLIGNTCPEFCNGLLASCFFKFTLGSNCLELFLESRFQNHPGSPILQKYHSLSNQSFKQNSVHMPSLDLTSISFLLNLNFVCSSLTVTAQKAIAYSPSTPCFICYYIAVFIFVCDWHQKCYVLLCVFS